MKLTLFFILIYTVFIRFGIMITAQDTAGVFGGITVSGWHVLHN